MDASAVVVGINELAVLLISLSVIGGVLWWLIDIRNQKTSQPIMNKLIEVGTQIGEHQKYTAIQFEDIKHEQKRHLDYIKEVDSEHTVTQEKVGKIEREVAVVRERLRMNGEGE